MVQVAFRGGPRVFSLMLGSSSRVMIAPSALLKQERSIMGNWLLKSALPSRADMLSVDIDVR
jgi:hypothetical protein